MKLNITIELDDIEIWDDEQQLTEAILKHIKREIVGEIWGKIKGTAKPVIEGKVSAHMEAKMDARIKQEIEAIIAEDKFTARFGKEQSLEEWVAEQFNNTRGYNALKDLMEKRAKQFIQQMQDRYDQLFATQIILKIRDQGLLKEEFAQSIQEEP